MLALRRLDHERRGDEEPVPEAAAVLAPGVEQEAMLQAMTPDDRSGIDLGWKPGEGVGVRHEFDCEQQSASADVTDQW